MEEIIKSSKILVIDDQPANTEILANLLAIKGYENVLVLNDSNLAIELIEATNPSLLLLDLTMPDVSGFDIMNTLKEKGYLEGVMQILVLTADATRESKQKALSSGACDFVVKPFDLIEVELRIKNLLFTNYLLTKLKDQNNLLEEKVKERTTELLNTNQALILSNDALREIAWTQSHIVRAPLARLMGLVALVNTSEDVLDFDRNGILKHIQNSAKELDGIIRDITNKTYTANIINN
jgi:DNA-binding response OmpR family regulator